MANALILLVSIKYRPIYTCHRCGGRQTGDVCDVESRSGTLDGIRLTAPAYAMPVGWGNYTEGHRCEGCRSTPITADTTNSVAPTAPHNI
jgi:hypothetical protein